MPRTLLLTACCALFLAGCQRGPDPATAPARLSGEPGATLIGEDGLLTASWDLTLSATAVTLTPAREGAALGDHYTINAGYFFTVSPDRQALQVRGFRLTPEGDLAVDWALRHPFRSVAQGANRADLDVFDVRLAFRPLDDAPQFFAGADRTIYSQLLQSAHGYTPDLGPMLPDLALIPYVIHHNEGDFNRLAQGTGYQPLTSTFRVQAGEQTRIRVYLLVQYGASATRQTRLTPVYYNPEYNLKAPWKLHGTVRPGALESGKVGLLEVDVEALDWNDSHTGAMVDSAYPDPANTDGLRSASDLMHVTLYAPDLNSTPVQVTVPDGGTGAPGDPLRYTLTVSTSSAPTAGTYQALLRALDSRVPNDNTGPAENGIHVPADGSLQFAALTEYSTWQVVEYTVEAGTSNEPPVAVISTNPDPPVVQVFQSVTFLGTGSTDDNGIVSYEWDFDYDPGSPAFTDLGPTPPPQSYSAEGTYTVALRVEDNGVPPLSDIATVTVTVNPLPPLACGIPAVWSLSSPGTGYRGQPTGSGGTLIASGRYFRISGDGNVVVYSAGAGIGGSLYVWRQSTGTQLLRPQSDDPMTYGFRADEVDLTNDGSVVVYTDARAGANPPKDSWIQSTLGGAALRLSPGDGGCYEWPRISQQGNQAVVYRRNGGAIFKVLPNGTGWTELITAQGGPASLNADGTRVYVEHTFRNLWRINIDGTGLTFLRYVGDYYVVAADESIMAYMDVFDGGRNVWVANVDGTGTPVKIHDAATAGFSAWYVSVKCDGSWVGYGANFGAGGSWHRATNQHYTSLAGDFPAGLYDGVTVGTGGAF